MTEYWAITYVWEWYPLLPSQDLRRVRDGLTDGRIDHDMKMLGCDEREFYSKSNWNAGCIMYIVTGNDWEPWKLRRLKNGMMERRTRFWRHEASALQMENLGFGFKFDVREDEKPKKSVRSSPWMISSLTTRISISSSDQTIIKLEIVRFCMLFYKLFSSLSCSSSSLWQKVSDIFFPYLSFFRFPMKKTRHMVVGSIISRGFLRIFVSANQSIRPFVHPNIRLCVGSE